MPPGVVDNTKLELGSANVYIDDPTEIFIGGTSAIDVTVREVWEPLETDQAGIGNRVLVLQEYFVEFAIREIQLVQFRRILASVQTIQDDVDANKKRIEFRALSGKDQLSFAKKITIKPIIAGIETVDLSKILVIPKAVPFADTVKWAYARQTQRELTARFAALPDSANKNRCMYMGDSTAVDANESGF